MMRALVMIVLALPLLAAKSDPLAGLVQDGPPRRCVTLTPQSGPTIVDENLILYRQGAGRTWRANTLGQCIMRPLDTLILDVFGGQLCRNDRFRVVQPGNTIPGPYCRFASFTPYNNAPRP